MATAVQGVGRERWNAGRLLQRSVRLWFLIAAAGLLAFASYILVFYGGSALRGDYKAWNEVLPNGFIAGDLVGNMVLSVHLALAFYITLAGPLQLIPRLRSAAPRFHRWNGRAYILVALLISLAGLALVWGRRNLEGWSLWNAIAISTNAVLIIAFACLAWRSAVLRDFAAHRRWALRLFLVVNGVWFLRIGVMLWILVNGGPAGLGKDLSGPAGIALTFAQCAVPLAVLESYFWAQSLRSARRKAVIAGLLLAASAATATGLVMAAAFMWLPLML
jgi:hypothetical protein